jgi:glutamine amidotransferase
VQKIVVIDYGMSNLHSVCSALAQVAEGQAEVVVSQDRAEIASADRVVFPGQGAAADCMHALNELKLADVVRKAASEKPFLGICMGMQVLLQQSEENDGTPCLGLYDGTVKSFRRHVNPEEKIKVPHMGWNTIQQKQEHPLWSGIPQDSYFYFVHSYFVQPVDEEYAIGRTDYGLEFASVIASDNVFAMQCHPEKSASNGLRLLANFIHWRGA